MKNCQHLYFLSAIACQLAECLDENELSVLSTDLEVLSDMIENLLARAACSEPDSSTPSSGKPTSTSLSPQSSGDCTLCAPNAVTK